MFRLPYEFADIARLIFAILQTKIMMETSNYLRKIPFCARKQRNSTFSCQTDQICRHVEFPPCACVKASEERCQLKQRWRIVLMKCKLRLVKHEMAARLACKLLYGGIVTVSCCCYINCVLEHVVEGTVVRICNFPRRSIVSCQQLLIKDIQTSSIMLTIPAVLF